MGQGSLDETTVERTPSQDDAAFQIVFTLIDNARQLSAESQYIRCLPNMIYLVSALPALGRASDTFDKYLWKSKAASKRVTGQVSN